MKTGIFLHGIYLGIEGWENLMWGEPPFKMGALPTIVRTILGEGAKNVSLIVLGSGTDFHKDGLTVAEYTKRFFLQRFPDIESFEEIRDHPKFQLHRARALTLLQNAVSGGESENTMAEIKNAIPLFTNAGIEKVIQISSGSHIARCLMMQLAMKEHGDISREQQWLAAGDDTFFGGTGAKDVTVIEPPHRGDDPMVRAPVKLHQVAQRIFKLPPQARIEIAREINMLLKRHEV